LGKERPPQRDGEAQHLVRRVSKETEPAI
jgi:hypothetical protein